VDFYKNSPELLHHLVGDTNLQGAAKQAVLDLQPLMQAMLVGDNAFVVTANQLAAPAAILNLLTNVAGVQLKAAIQTALDPIDTLGSLAGMNAGDARTLLLGVPIEITNPKILPNGAFEFTLTGEIAGTLRIEYSEDLARWSLLNLPPILELPSVVTDERPVAVSQRYYRVVVVP
jgi:hypothetical protein